MQVKRITPHTWLEKATHVMHSVARNMEIYATNKQTSLHEQLENEVTHAFQLYKRVVLHLNSYPHARKIYPGELAESYYQLYRILSEYPDFVKVPIGTLEDAKRDYFTQALMYGSEKARGNIT